MIAYPHFALPNLYLLNGYREVETEYGPTYEYEHEEELEHCVRRLLLRAPRRLRGWDLRFLRRGLGLSQSELGDFVDRDAQTIARWEKVADALPKFADLAIRTRFADEYEPWMTIGELVSYVDGTARPLPSVVLLKHSDGVWTFDLEPRITYPLTHTEHSIIVNFSGVYPVATYRELGQAIVHHDDVMVIGAQPSVVTEASDGRVSVRLH